jgi:hypothetical protein
MAQKSTWILIYKFNAVNSIDLSEALWHEMKVATHENEFPRGKINMFSLLNKKELVALNNTEGLVMPIYNKEFILIDELYFDPNEWNLDYFDVSPEFIKSRHIECPLPVNYVNYYLVQTEPVVIALENLIRYEYIELAEKENMVILYHIYNDEEYLDTDRQLNAPEIFGYFKQWWQSRK